MVTVVHDTGIKRHLAPVTCISAVFQVGWLQLKVIIAYRKRISDNHLVVCRAPPASGIGDIEFLTQYGSTLCISKSNINYACAFMSCRHHKCVRLRNSVFKREVDDRLCAGAAVALVRTRRTFYICVLYICPTKVNILPSAVGIVNFVAAKEVMPAKSIKALSVAFILKLQFMDKKIKLDNIEK